MSSKFLQRATGCLVVILMASAGCGSGGAATAEDPPKPSVPAAAPATRPGVDYGQEVSRLVENKDQIVSILRNGMRVVVKRVASPAVSVRGYVQTGGIYEGKWLGAGLSHLLEHLVAGGSNGRRTEAENRNLLQRIGNNSNAYTTFDHTAYFVNTTADNLDKAADLVTGWMLTATITPDEFRREHQVVQRELQMDEGEADWVFQLLTERNRYRVSPMGVPVIGYQAVIQGLARDDVYNYYKQAYVPNNMVFAVTGNLDPEVMLKAVRKYVADAPPGRAFSHEIAPEPPVLDSRTMVATFPKLGQARLELAFPSVKLDNPDMYALDLLATILASGESSILVEEIRDKRGLVSSIAASDFTPDFVEGSFSIDMQVDSPKIGEATAAVLEQIEKVQKDGVSQDRLERAKTQTRTARAFSQQTSEAVAGSMATDLISTGDPNFSDKYVDRMQKVTAEQIKAAANKYLKRNVLLTTALVTEETKKEQGLALATDLLRKAAPTTRKTTAQGSTAVTRVVLGDGTVLLLKRVPTAPLAVVQMYALGGLTAEDAKSNGLGNLAMLTAPRGTKNRSVQEVAEFFDSIGSDLSTLCGNNTWSWSTTCLKGDLDKTLDVFADVVKNPAFPGLEVAQMKRRVMAAIDSQDADWAALAMRFFRKSYFGPLNSPYQFLTIGTKDNVERFSVDQVKSWYYDQVLGGRRVLAIYGDIDVEQAKSLSAKYFGGVKEAPAESPVTVKEAGAPPIAKPTIVVDKVLVNPTRNPQAGVVIGFDSQTVLGNPQNYALIVADTMAAGYGYPTGYLFEVLRGQGLVYVVQAMPFFGRSEKYPGAFVVMAGCEPRNVNRVVDLALENIARLQGTQADLQPDWFARAKELVTTSDALEHETAASQASTAALDELFHLGYDYHAYFADKIKAVQIEQVQSVARRLLTHCIVTISTNEPQLVKVKEGERTYSSFPRIELAPRGVQHDVGAAGR